MPESVIYRDYRRDVDADLSAVCGQLMGTWELSYSPHFSRPGLPMSVMDLQSSLLSLRERMQSSQCNAVLAGGGERGTQGTGSMSGSLTCLPQVQQAENLGKQ